MPEMIHQGSTTRPYCRVEPFDPGYSNQGQSGVRIQRVDVDGEPLGEPLLFTDTGAERLENLVRAMRLGTRS